MNPTTLPNSSRESTALLRETRVSTSKNKHATSGEKKSHNGLFLSLSPFWMWCVGIITGMALFSASDVFYSNESSSAPKLQKHSVRGVASVLTSHYTHVQTLGFQIYTGGAPAFLDAVGSNESNAKTENEECIDRHSYGIMDGDNGDELMCYLGLGDPIIDVEVRTKIMRDAIHQAYEKSSKDKSTIKVFLVPEFYWRGVTGAYYFDKQREMEDPSYCGPICRVLRSLEAIVAEKKFEDWFFGTVVASELFPSDNDDLQYVFYNFAPIYKGYDPKRTTHHGKRFLLPKRYVSSSDFLTPKRHLSEPTTKELVDEPRKEYEKTVLNPSEFFLFRYDNHVLWNDYKNELNALGYIMIEYGWLILDGITLSIEICLDHLKRRALTTYLADVVTGSTTLIPSTSRNKGISYVPIPKHQAQVSFVSSAGMTLELPALALTQNGTVFLQDGLSSNASSLVCTKEVGSGCSDFLEVNGGSEAIKRQAVLTNTDAFFAHHLITGSKKYSVYPSKQEWTDALDGVFSTKMYEPMITVYEPIEISAVPSSNARRSEW